MCNQTKLEFGSNIQMEQIAESSTIRKEKMADEEESLDQVDWVYNAQKGSGRNMIR